MDGQFIGSLVSIDCGEVLGVYQGEVDAVDTETHSISIVSAFRNGLKCTVPRITIS